MNEDIIKKLIDQFEGKDKREYPQGRIGADDEGALALAVSADKEHGVVRVDFGKSISWFALVRIVLAAAIATRYSSRVGTSTI